MTRNIQCISTLLLLIVSSATGAQQLSAGDVLPHPEPAFKGEIGLSAAVSTPDWPKPLAPPAEAPNVLLILLDDVGFADASTFGGAIETPALDRLASEGLRYTNFYTASMCSPTRAALLTGRNHHRVGAGRITALAGGYPGYDSVWKRDTASIARVLQGNGYSTAAFGKWHNTPDWELSPVGPFDRWPTGLGFDYFYGFMDGADNQWSPAMLYRNTTPVEPPYTPAEGYHFTKDIADEAMRWMRTHEGLAPNQPWFIYFAPGATHAPHHAPREWIERYRGKFDQGWDALRQQIFARQKKLGVIPADARLNPRPPGFPAWNDLSVDEKRLLSRQMEVYAGFLAHTDHEVGRLIDAVRRAPDAENTLILYVVGDNGPEGTGGRTGGDLRASIQVRAERRDELGTNPDIFNGYSYGWAWAGATPFTGTKAIASHLGGLRNPMILSWPAVIKDHGGVRTQFAHVNDVASTIYEAARIEPPQLVDGIRQAPFNGVSLVYSFSDPAAPARHRIQYFEMWSNRALYQDGWFACARNTSLTNRNETGKDPQLDTWELYDLTKDFSQSRNVAAAHPQRLAAMRQLFDAQARDNNVYPLGGGGKELRYDALPLLSNRARTLTFYPDTDRLPSQSVFLRQKSYRIDVHLSLSATRRDVHLIDLCLYCSLLDSRNVLSIKNGAAVLDYSNSKGARQQLVSPLLEAGPNVVTFAFEKAPQDAVDPTYGVSFTPGVSRLYVNDTLVGEVDVAPLSLGALVFPLQKAGTATIDRAVDKVVLTMEDR